MSLLLPGWDEGLTDVRQSLPTSGKSMDQGVCEKRERETALVAVCVYWGGGVEVCVYVWFCV